MRSVLTLALLISFGCGDITGSSSLCTGSVDVTATPGLTPQFAWAPGCPVELLTVYQREGTSRGAQVWSLHLAGGFRPPISYGVLPSGAAPEGQFAAVPLESGRSYLVVLTAEQGWFTSGRLTGQRVFTP